MNYIKIYDKICSRGKLRKITGYFESHHIIPKCMGGTNDEANIVKLTAEEHFLAHLLLVKIYPNNYKLMFALSRMSGSSAGHQKRTGKWYSWTRKRFSEAISKSNKGRKYPNRKPCSEEYRLAMSKSKSGKKQNPEHIRKRVEARLKTMYGKLNNQ